MTQSADKLRSILARYAAGPSLVRSSIQGLDATQLDLTISPDGWSIRQLIHHIVDGDYLWKEFLLQAAGDPQSQFTLEWYWSLPQDEWVKRWTYAGRDVNSSLVLFEANRRHTLELLDKAPWLFEKSLLIPNRQGGHELISVVEVVEMQSRHVEGHVEEIHKIRQGHGV